MAEKVLIVDDSPDDAELVVRALRRGGHEIEFDRVDTADAMRAALKENHWDIVIADYSMPHFSGIAALDLLKSQNLDLPFILISGTVGEEIAVQAMKAGAQDYIVKHNLARLPLAVERELRDAEMRRERTRAEARYRSLFERVPVAVFSIAPDGSVLEANPAFVQMLGFRSPDEVSRLNIASLWDDPNEFFKRNDIIMREGVIRNYESRLRRVDGSIIWCAESVRAEYIAGGTSVRRFEGVAVDITERKRIQQELTLARDAALETARLKSEFLANMSHEIRTPLNGVIGMCELLRATELNSEQQDCADLIGNSADSLLTIVNDILDFSKLSAGKLMFEQIDFELAQTVDGVIKMLSESARKKGLELILTMSPELPKFVRGDPTRLRQVMTNLIGNAIKFTERGEVVVRIKPEGATATEAIVQFEVTDTGVGMSSDALRGLFQPFYQADGSTTRKYGGTGLGLAISAQLVERMGGKIEVKSELDKGSTFVFSAHFAAASSASQSSFNGADLRGLRALVVDDNHTNRQIICRQIAAWGMIGETAAGGAEALTTLRDHAGHEPFDIAILDHGMPGMDGLMLARLIKTDAELAHTLLLVMSSFGSRGEAGADNEPIDAWLTKPVKQAQLYDSIAALTSAGLRTVTLETAAPSPNTVREQRGRCRILLAEDNAINQVVASHQLLKLGYPSDVVSDGNEALEALASHPYPLVLMDCMMPDMDGFETTAELRRREAGSERHTIIVAMTANALEGDREKCLAAGMDDYLAKPVRLEKLEVLLDHWLIETGERTSGESGVNLQRI